MPLLQLTSADVSLETAGGKGLNLARLAQAGFPVPPAVIIDTPAYQDFVEANRLRPVIAAASTGLAPDQVTALDDASNRIRAAFAQGQIPIATAHDLDTAYRDLGAGPVAVRSSATAEDLPELSFAGQQDTYLNVIGLPALHAAVISCWSSLWTARAIGYRLRNGLPHDGIGLAVVVQVMIPSEVAGVLFTANPLTGRRNEIVIDATVGLGEALVSGQVEPDHYVLDAATGQVREQTLGAKQVATRARAEGGVETVAVSNPARPTLDAPTLAELADLGRRIQATFGAPQDIEWALANGTLAVLQSRPITSLFPLPPLAGTDTLARQSPPGVDVWLSFGAIQGVLEPITPLGRDVIAHVFAGAARLFGRAVSPGALTILASAGERLWIKLSDVLRHPIGRHLVPQILRAVEPGTRNVLLPLLREPELGAGRGRLRWSTVTAAARFLFSILKRVPASLHAPEAARTRLERDFDGYLAAARLVVNPDPYQCVADVVAFLRQHPANAFPHVVPRFAATLGPGLASLALLHRLAGERRDLALEITRGLPHNVTTQMDLALWQTAKRIRADPAAHQVFGSTTADDLTRRYLDQSLPDVAQTAVRDFLQRYGMRGVAEIDFGQVRWREAPQPVFHSLQSYLSLPDEAGPDVVFARGAVVAEAAIESLVATVRAKPLGGLRAALVRAAARRVRALAGVRESPKFFIVRLFGIARAALLSAGRELVAAGVLNAADDLVFLTVDELAALAEHADRDWRSVIAARRQARAREHRRRQVPRLLLSDGRAFYAGLGVDAADGGLHGSPVSPGVVEGVVHVVLDPRGVQLAPGEILVCPGTDPAWTPLFMTAGGLVTEVGGMMTHGSVVAREYGIPAVVGVHAATTRLHTGQRIRLNGSSGQIQVLG